jgi:nicotinamide riboside kinase
MSLVAFPPKPWKIRKGPVTVVLYGGPGTGKSTTAAQVFALLKQRELNVEIVHEVAKDLTWEQRHVALSHQPYIAAKQMFRMDRLYGRVEGIVTDTSPLLGYIYGKGLTQPFKDWLLDDYQRRRTLDVFIERNPRRPYNPNGRRQSEESAVAADSAIRGLLRDLEISHYVLPLDERLPHRVADLAESRIKYGVSG